MLPPLASVKAIAPVVAVLGPRLRQVVSGQWRLGTPHGGGWANQPTRSHPARRGAARRERGQPTAPDAARSKFWGPGFPLFAAGGLVPQSD
jgi:hypothetical protein